MGVRISKASLRPGSSGLDTEFMAVRILIADDHPVVRHGLRTLLGERQGWEVVAEAADGMEAVEMATRLSPDVAVLDLSMPRLHGLEACRKIREKIPNCEILIVTQHDSPQMLHEALQCGAKGYVVKSNAARDLLAAVDAVSQHRNFTAWNNKGKADAS
jgi:DNA-binding NarL/FixJ family response regulator